MSLVWKAGLSPRLASQVQLRLGGIPPRQVLSARGGEGWPLSSDDMNHMNVDYSTKIPNNVNLSEDRQVLKALEGWHPGYMHC